MWARHGIIAHGEANNGVNTDNSITYSVHSATSRCVLASHTVHVHTDMHVLALALGLSSRPGIQSGGGGLHTPGRLDYTVKGVGVT